MILKLVRTSILFTMLAVSSLTHAEEEKKLNIYNWSDYITPETITNFEKDRTYA